MGLLSSRWPRIPHVAMLLWGVASCDEAAHSGEGDSGSQLLERRCEAPPGLGRPTTIGAVVELINALPKPVSLPCFLESLDRPLGVYASSSTAGAQPAEGERSPRIFVLLDALILSVVPDGPSQALLELGEGIGDRRSIKAEIEFPVTQPLADSEPYARVDGGSGTSCGVCHTEERSHVQVGDTYAYGSDMFQDDPNTTVSLAFVRQHFLSCDHEGEPQRCELLDSIFGHGEVVSQDLPRDSKVCRGF